MSSSGKSFDPPDPNRFCAESTEVDDRDPTGHILTETGVMAETTRSCNDSCAAPRVAVQSNLMDASAKSEEDGTVCLLKVVASRQTEETQEKERQKLESYYDRDLEEQAQEKLATRQRQPNDDGMTPKSPNHKVINQDTIIRKEELGISKGIDIGKQGRGEMIFLQEQDIPGKESNISRTNSPGVHLTNPATTATAATTTTTEDTGNAPQIPESEEERNLPPQPALIRGQQNVARMVAPGAVAVDGPGSRDNVVDAEEDDEVDSSSSGSILEDGPERPSTDDDLAVANLVEEESHRLADDLPLAQEHDADTASARQKEQRVKHCQGNTTILVGIAALVVAALIVVAVVVPNRAGRPEEEAASLPAVTMAPTTPADRLLALFPAETVVDIGISGSAQSEAFDWLMEEVEDLSGLPSYRILQRYALATLFHSAGGNGWYNTTHWLDHNIHECEWYNKPDFAQKIAINQAYPGYLRGFLEPSPTSPCSYGGIYRHLWLDFHNLVGSLPKELFLLTSLQTMSFSYNALEGTISSFIGKLTDLEGFVCHNNQITGNLPSEIGLLSPLSFLGVKDNALDGTLPEELWNLTRMKMFSFFNNPELGGTLSTMIGNMSDLRTFVTDRSSMKGTLPTELGLLLSMDRMAFDQNGMVGPLPSELGNLSGMRYFSVRGNALSATIPSELGRLAAATSLVIGENQLTGPLPSQLGLIRTLYEHLFIAENQLSSTIPPQIGQLTSLLKLEASDNRFTGHLPSEFGRLSSMVRLTLANNSFSGTVPEELEALSDTLHTFWLQSNPLLSGTIPSNLCNISGDCLSSIWLQTDCEGSAGLSFDCTDMLCGCACSCDG